jgi:hypothetical protein
LYACLSKDLGADRLVGINLVSTLSFVGEATFVFRRSFFTEGMGEEESLWWRWCLDLVSVLLNDLRSFDVLCREAVFLLRFGSAKRALLFLLGQRTSLLNLANVH